MTDGHASAVPSHQTTPLFPIPAFQGSNVPLWFRQLEYCFHGATEQLPRYHATITAIPFSLLTRIEDELAKAENTTTPYDHIKKAIIAATSATPHDRLTAILSQQSLGDRKPTDFLQHLLSLLSPGQATLEDSLIRPLFLQKLPSQAQTILSTFPLSTPLKDLAAAADRMLQVISFPDINSAASPSVSLPPSTPLPLISAANIPHPSELRVSHLEKEVRDLRREITLLSTQIGQLQLQLQYRSRSPSPSPSRSYVPRSPSRSHSPSPAPHSLPNSWCYYHQRFQHRDIKCISPCSFQQGNEGQN